MADSMSTPFARPTDGFGGSLYFSIILLPVYYALNRSELDNQSLPQTPGIGSCETTFYFIDELLNRTQALAALDALILGLTTLTLLNSIALTPQQKRRLPIFHWLTLGLTLQTASSIFSLWLDTAGPNASSYLQLTYDYTFIEFSHRFIIINLLHNTFAVFAGICVQCCLFIQARSLLSSMRVHVKYYIYVGLLAVLTFFGLVAVVLQIIVAIWEICDYTLIHTPLDTILSLKDAGISYLQLARSIAHAISIGCWCTVIGYSSINESWKRRKLLFNGIGGLQGNQNGPKQTRYDAVLNLIGLLTVESFIIPIMLCFLQFFLFNTIFLNVEECIEPVVLCLLPLRSIFLNGTANEHEYLNLNSSTNEPAQNSARSRGSRCLDLFSANNSAAGNPRSNNAIDRELHEIDTMTSNNTPAAISH